MAVDYIAIIRDDNTLFHDGPSGVLEVLQGWGSGAAFPETTAQPSGWTSYVPWAHVMRDATGARAPLSAADANRPWRDSRVRRGNSAVNSRVHARHQQMLWLLNNGQWAIDFYGDQFGDVIYPFDWLESNQSTMPAPNFRRFENGGGSSIRAISLANDTRNPSSPNQWRDWQWHPFGSRNVVPSGWVGALSCFFARRIVDDPGGPDDRDQMNILAGCSWDWYLSQVLSQPPAQGVNVLYGGFSRLKYLTNDWQLFANTNLSEAQLRANPPPIIGLDLLEVDTTPLPVVIPPVPTFGTGRWVTRLSSSNGRWLTKDPQAPQLAVWEQPVPTATVDIGTTTTIAPQLTNPGVPAATFSKVSGPAWATVNTSTGVVTLTNIAGPAGTQTVVVRAANASGNADLSIVLTVRDTTVVTPPDPPPEPTPSEWTRIPRDAEVWIRVPRAPS